MEKNIYNPHCSCSLFNDGDFILQTTDFRNMYAYRSSKWFSNNDVFFH
jgi:hypothetical protein